MRFLSLFLIVASANAGTEAPVGSAAVWNPPAGFFAGMHAACDAHSDRLAECFRERVRAAGASPEAVAFPEVAFDFAVTGKFVGAHAIRIRTKPAPAPAH